MKFAGQLQWTDYLNAQLLHLRPKGFIKIVLYGAISVMALGIIYGLYLFYLFVTGEYYASLSSILMIFFLPVFWLFFVLLYRYDHYNLIQLSIYIYILLMDD